MEEAASCWWPPVAKRSGSMACVGLTEGAGQGRGGTVGALGVLPCSRGASGGWCCAGAGCRGGWPAAPSDMHQAPASAARVSSQQLYVVLPATHGPGLCLLVSVAVDLGVSEDRF